LRRALLATERTGVAAYPQGRRQERKGKKRERILHFFKTPI
jgi:hypothetical protein